MNKTTGLWIIAMLANLAIIAGIIWSAVHFIKKFW